MMLHSSAQQALVIGLGTGITLDQVAQYPNVSVDCAEISPAVVEISKAFTRENQNVLQRPNVNLAVQDGRNLLLTWNKQYDVIVSEPSNPWQTGNANLFTHEFYRLAAQRLNPGGIYCQWLPMYDMPTSSLRTAINTFLQTFPETLAFGVGVDILLLGRVAENKGSGDITLPRRFPVPAQDLELFAPDMESLFRRFYFGDSTVLTTFAKGAPLNTDTYPRLEFDRQMGEDRREANYKALMAARRTSAPTRFPFAFQ